MNWPNRCRKVCFVHDNVGVTVNTARAVGNKMITPPNAAIL